MGDEAEDILYSFVLSDENQKKYDTVKKAFDDHFIIPKHNTIWAGEIQQEEGESVDTFITDLYTLAEHVGIRNSQLSEQDSKLTLASAIALVRQKEWWNLNKKNSRVQHRSLEQSRSLELRTADHATCPKCGRSPPHDHQH